ncbi:unnamed protein product [Paramecium sonneborni]|uniref:H-type lectin domain-containing protein n=1 Tax=Paramecium sonneborni TaxID=65129 RepID=A0A8S1RGM8_9CILI|nr:unnamed protein product [Paramecium sonneborni]
MNKLIYILCILLSIANGFITNDSGSKSGIEPGNSCQNSYSTTLTIPFSQQFENIPQVIIILTRWTLYYGSTEFKLQITSTTTSNFQVQISCPHTQVFYVYFNWYAIDDQRVQVINQFNFANPVTQTFSHHNPNALYGFISPISFGGNGLIDCNLQITSITKTTVTVGLSGQAGKIENLKQIGYQIILGIQEVFDILSIQTTALYNSGNNNLQANKWLLTPIVAVTNPPNDSIRLWIKYTTTSTTISYNIETWGYPYSPNTHNKIWMSYAINEQFTKMLLLTVRISQKFDKSSITSPSIQLQMPQINESYSSNGVYTATFDQSQTPVQMNVQMKCFNGKKIKSLFSKCNNCPENKNYLFSHFCHSNINQISYFAKFTPTKQAHNEIKITISDSEINIAHVVYNQIKTEAQILNILLINA